MPASPQAVLERLNDAVRRLDFDGCMACCTEDTEWIFVGDRTLRGKAAVRKWMEETYLQAPQFEVHRMIADADSVAVLGEILLDDAAGRPVRHQYCDVWRLRDGKMAELRAFVLAA